MSNFGFKAEVEMVIRDVGAVQSIGDLQEIGKLVDYWIEPRSAYVDLNGFILKNLDLRVGHQIVTWGTADMLNPTNFLNPYDLSDPFAFDRTMANTMLKGTYFINDVTITGVLAPFFKPSRLPPDAAVLISAFDATNMPIPGMSLNDMSDTVILPEKNARNMSGAIKTAAKIFDFDLSVSYYYGYDHLPQPTALSLIPYDATNPFSFNGKLNLEYYRIQGIGFDVAGAILDVGVWGEAAVIIPEEVKTGISVATPLGSIDSSVIAVKDEPFVKFVIGGDYTFKGGWYVQAQYLHGFMNEIGKDNLGNYAMIALEKRFINDELTIRLAGGGEMRDSDTLAFFGMPEISYKPGNGVEVALGAHIIDGDEGTMFNRWNDRDDIYLTLKKSF
jgi:hypothetical protein